MNEQDITGTIDSSAVYTFDDSGIRRTDPNFLKLRVTPSLPSNQFDEPLSLHLLAISMHHHVQTTKTNIKWE